MEKRFNLIDENWIPVQGHGKTSLKKIFTNREYTFFSGNPIQKISLMKFFLAIAQSAQTSIDEEQHKKLDFQCLMDACLKYLDKWYENFYLYSDKPFLQIPEIKKAKSVTFGALLPEISTGNTTILSQIQSEKPLDDAEKALLLLTLSSCSLGGKKTDNSVILSPGYPLKVNQNGGEATSKPGPSIGFRGFLHNFLLSNSLQKTIWLNLFTKEQIQEMRIYPMGLGVAPWENMPKGEDCIIAQELKQTLMGRLIPLSRFCLLSNEGMHYSEGIIHQNYTEGMFDPSVAINTSKSELKALWADPEKRPWRQLTSLLSFIECESTKSNFNCMQTNDKFLKRARKLEEFCLWSGGLRITSNVGEQYVSGNDDFVESQTWFDSKQLGKNWFSIFEKEMSALDDLSKKLYKSIASYFHDFKLNNNSNIADQACRLFWQICERDAQSLIAACETRDDSKRKFLRKSFLKNMHTIYEQSCPNETSRQIDLWTKYYPNTSQYLLN